MCGDEFDYVAGVCLDFRAVVNLEGKARYARGGAGGPQAVAACLGLDGAFTLPTASLAARYANTNPGPIVIPGPG